MVLVQYYLDRTWFLFPKLEFEEEENSLQIVELNHTHTKCIPIGMQSVRLEREFYD